MSVQTVGAMIVAAGDAAVVGESLVNAAGPPGCGKTALAHAIANACGVPFLRIAAPEIVSGMSGVPCWQRVCNAKP